MAIGVIARLTLREAARRKILWAAFILGLAFLILYGVGVYLIEREAMRGKVVSNYLQEMHSFLAMAPRCTSTRNSHPAT